MTLSALVDQVAAQPRLAALTADRPTTADLVSPAGARPFLAAAAARIAPVLVVTATYREAEELVDQIRCLVDEPESVGYYPAWETLPHERLSPRSDTVGKRLATLRRLVHPDPSDPATGPIRILVTPVRTVLQPQVAGLGDLEGVRLRVGDEIDLDELAHRLSAAAYTRVDLVEHRGEFAVRGGIVDVFAPTEQHPVRVDFFGDEVEEIRYFSVADQRSAEVVEHGLWAAPCAELLLTDSVRSRAADLAQQYPQLHDLFDKLAQGHPVEGMESLAPALVDSMELLVELLDPDTIVLASDPERIRARAHDLVATSEEFLAASWAAAAGGGQAPIDLRAASFAEFADVRSRALGRGLAWWDLSAFGLDSVEDDTDSTDAVADAAADAAAAVATPLPVYREPLEAVDDIRGWLTAGARVTVVADGPGSAQRFSEMYADADLPNRLVEAPDAVAPGVLEVTSGTLGAGVVFGTLVVLTEDGLAAARTQRGRDRNAPLPRKRKNAINPLELVAGDHVVHDQHGVGRFVEMLQRTVGRGPAATTREYLVIEFAPSKRGQPGDRLFVPTDALDQVTRYVGGETPSLDRLGGSDWAKRKGRARKAVRQIAAQLIQLYAARQATHGHAFSHDTPWQRELEEAFAYVETPDQLSTIDDVKRDMELSVPMDRVVCGDVGYGKTEIAVRAAFKAVQDGKQVAVLVPTTLLAQQHFATFSERYAAFPVKVASLSRFNTDAEAKATLAGLAGGTVDVVIGTHRLLGKDVVFKDLGLVVVDEEQRFGVEHKESLKALRTAVDVLTMSATPIPRTLEMSITGIREMSTIATPPEDRHPVLTFVGAYSDKQVIAAIRRELLREGQVFFVHNRVETIEKTAAAIRRLVPEARVSTAHGQMGEHALEQVIIDFWEKRSDVIVCTTIVENGLDIANANTLIVDRSDRLGLSQLHQLRGRVGRGRERAYAYFFYPPDKPLTETSHDRLATISQHSDLGGGMAVAMKDLEIRGAGNLLGGEQSGHIADVGFDLYVRLVGEAVAEFRGDAEPDLPEVKIELPVDAHLPHDYIDSQRLRLDIYQRLAAAHTEADVAAVGEELLDRYGELPEPVLLLLAVANFRNAARAAGLREVVVAGRNIRFAGWELPESKQMRIKRLYPGTLLKLPTKVALIPAPLTAPVAGRPVRDAELLAWASKVVAEASA